MAFPRPAHPSRRLHSDRRGNAMMIFAFALIPMVFATGMTIDYSRAARLKTKLNALTDAAALSAVTPAMMLDTRANAAATARRMWTTQATGLNSLLYSNAGTLTTSTTPTSITTDDGTLKIVITDSNTTGLTRTVQVSYSAASKNIFSSLLRSPQIDIGGTSTAKSSTSPNIDFYLLLDISGSMALPSTSAGLKQLTKITNGCAFACHSIADATAKTANGQYADYYTVARSYGIPLRVDEMAKAAQNLMTLAASTAQQRGVTYRAGVSTFARIGKFANIVPLTTDLAGAGIAASKVETSVYYTNGCPAILVNGQWKKDNCNNDTDTASSDAFTRMNTLMPTPGTGSQDPSDTPQQVMFVVTDGMRDETRSSGPPEVKFDTAKCDPIKNKGTRIAILYTEYLPESLSDGWSKDNVLPRLNQVEPALQACASPGLYYKVTTDDDISAALAALFQTAVATARLTN